MPHRKSAASCGEYIPKGIKIPQYNGSYYIENIQHPDIQLPIVKDWNAHVFHIFTILTPRRDELQKYLLENGVQTLIHYPIPPHKQRCYKELNGSSFPIAEKIHEEELSLPINPSLKIEEIKKVIKSINSFSKL